MKKAVEARDLVFRAGSHAASHALLNVAPLYITCNASDLGTECANPHDKRAIPERILLYDQHPGGIGLAWQVKFSISTKSYSVAKFYIACFCPQNKNKNKRKANIIRKSLNRDLLFLLDSCIQNWFVG